MKIALLTMFDENYREIADRTLPSMRRYADIFGLELLIMRPEAQDRPALWGKIKLIREVLQSGLEYCLFVDADSIFVRFDEDIRDRIIPSKDLYLCWHCPNNSESYSAIPGHFNTGVMLWRNCAWSIDFLEEIWRQTDFINHFWHEQAAMLNLLGYRSRLGLGGNDDPDPDRIAHVQKLPIDWNVIVGATIGPDPIIRHFAGCSKAMRLLGLDRENAVQTTRETLPLSARHLLSRQLNLIHYQEQQLLQVKQQLLQVKQQLQQTEERTNKVFAEHKALLRSRTRLGRAWWRAVRWKLGVSSQANDSRLLMDEKLSAHSGDLRHQGIHGDLTIAARARRAEINNALAELHGLSVVSGPFVGMKLVAEFLGRWRFVA